MPAILALLSSLAWGTADFLGGTLSRKRAAIAVVGGSQIFGLTAMMMATVMSGQFHFDASVIRYGTLAGTFGLVGLVTFYQALSTGAMGIVSPIASMSVALPVLIGLTRGERPTGIELGGMAIAVIGLLLACGPELSGEVKAKPIVLASVAAITFGICVFFMAEGGKHNVLMTVTTMRFTQVAILLVVAVSVRSIGGLQKQDFGILLAIGITDAGANVLFATAASKGLLSITAVLGSLFPIVTVILAWLIHHERLQKIQYVGVALTLIGIACISA